MSKKQFIVYTEFETHAAFKALCAEEFTSISDKINDFVKNYIKQKRSEKVDGVVTK